MKVIKIIVLVNLVFLLLVGCAGPRAFQGGQYDDPDNITLLDDKYNEADMKMMADKLVGSLMKEPWIKDSSKRVLMQVSQVSNRTHEHIDVKMLTDKIRTALIKTRKISFVAAELRKNVAEEYEYQQSGYMKKDTAKGPGGQIGADYMVFGDIGSHVQEMGKDKIVYYKVTLNVSNLSTNTIEWTDDVEIKKRFQKKRISM